MRRIAFQFMIYESEEMLRLHDKLALIWYINYLRILCSFHSSYNFLTCPRKVQHRDLWSLCACHILFLVHTTHSITVVDYSYYTRNKLRFGLKGFHIPPFISLYIAIEGLLSKKEISHQNVLLMIIFEFSFTHVFLYSLGL